jgi:hexosaminidase
MEKFLNSKGRSIIGWDEIMEGGLAPNATVMSWRGTKGGIAAAKSHHNVIMTPTDYCYFDYYQGDPQNEPTAIGGYLPLKKVYGYEPVPTELTPEEAKYILAEEDRI